MAGSGERSVASNNSELLPRAGTVGALDLVRLPPVMALSQGSSEVTVALVDGPVLVEHPGLEADGVRWVLGSHAVACREQANIACRHGTFVAGILKATRGSWAPAICPGCTLLVRPIFAEVAGDELPSADVREVAAAILECVDAGARVINVSAATPEPTMREEPELDQSLTCAARRGVLVIAAAGNQGTLGSSALTRHPGVLPVAAYDARAQPMRHSNVGGSVGKRGLGAPGEAITSLGSDGSLLTLAGTSFAAPFVTGAIALLWSLFPGATAAEIRHALRAGAPRWRRSVVPPLLDTWGAYRFLAQLTASSATTAAQV
jgi:subtilisin family serine protease